MSIPLPHRDTISENVTCALAEDVGGGDLTAALVPASRQSEGRVVAREDAVLCGSAWFDEVFRQLDRAVGVHWFYGDGDWLEPGVEVCRIQGPSRAVLTGERTALNFLQFLSGTATTVRRFADALAGAGVQLLDTRKTVPGLRAAQKYAVRAGGASNHRFGLFDAYLIKENHIAACGGVTPAVEVARLRAAGTPITVEIEKLAQLDEAIAAGADVVMLDNFDTEGVRKAVDLAAGRVALEVSGGLDLDAVRDLAATGVDRISVGALTKNVYAVDFSLRLDAAGHRNASG